MKKLYNFRIDTTLIKQLDQMKGNRTYNLTNALQMYLHNPQETPSNNLYIVKIMQQTIDDLRQDKQIMQHRIDYLTLPFFKRLFLPMHSKQ